MKDKKETPPPTKQEIEKQVAEFGEVLGFNKEKFIELVDKKCKMCKTCKCKKDEKKED